MGVAEYEESDSKVDSRRGPCKTVHVSQKQTVWSSKRHQLRRERHTSARRTAGHHFLSGWLAASVEL
ncbi:hypothetical protein M405DRAFT_834821 [Rhizopogon salebrosus TDB-379]|nr:hypothetical protein M405DRAFT_834821 [Rhizopogon salebrosus TDB-379]